MERPLPHLPAARRSYVFHPAANTVCRMNEPQSVVTVPAPTPHGCDFVSRNFRVNGRRTSIRLEHAMWQAFEDIAARENSPLRELCATIDAKRHGGNLTAAVRLFIIGYFRLAATKAEPADQPQLRVVAPAPHNHGFADSAPSQPIPSTLMRRALSAIE